MAFGFLKKIAAALSGKKVQSKPAKSGGGEAAGGGKKRRRGGRGHGTRPLTFASADDLAAILGLIPGAVTPLGLLNDAEHRVTLYLDEDFFAAPGLIGVHPNDNTATVWLKTPDLIELLRGHGCAVETVDLSMGEGK